MVNVCASATACFERPNGMLVLCESIFAPVVSSATFVADVDCSDALSTVVSHLTTVVAGVDLSDVVVTRAFPSIDPSVMLSCSECVSA